MPKVTIYHNPNCSKSRRVLQLLIAHGINPEIVEYLKTPPNPQQLLSIIEQLNIKAGNLIRIKEKSYHELNIDKDSLTDAELVNIMVQHPILIERPIVLTNHKAIIGRPPEKVLEII